jgi:O-methyltransferase
MKPAPNVPGDTQAGIFDSTFRRIISARRERFLKKGSSLEEASGKKAADEREGATVIKPNRVLKDLYAREWFLRRAGTSEESRERRRLLNQFAQIQKSIRCEHESRELLVMVDYILGKAPAGALVECGCYQGGSSAKLSLVAAMTGRQLYVCDSFQGLPDVSEVDRRNGFSSAGYAATTDQVRTNIERHGSFGVCHLVEGFFDESLKALTGIPTAFVFSDADLVSSTRGVIRFLWPTLVEGGRLYTHDANLPDLVRAIYGRQVLGRANGRVCPTVVRRGIRLRFWGGLYWLLRESRPRVPWPCSTGRSTTRDDVKVRMKARDTVR